MPDKNFKTIEEQLEILRSCGLTIDDEAAAKDFLLRNNYYRISGTGTVDGERRIHTRQLYAQYDNHP